MSLNYSTAEINSILSQAEAAPKTAAEIGAPTVSEMNAAITAAIDSLSIPRFASDVGAANANAFNFGLAAKADVDHGHLISEITGLQQVLDELAILQAGFNTSGEGGIPPSSSEPHSHPISEILGLRQELDDLSSEIGTTSHTHSISDITGLQNHITNHTHTASQITDLQARIDASVNTASGVQPTSQPYGLFFAGNEDSCLAVKKSERHMEYLGRLMEKPFTISFNIYIPLVYGGVAHGEDTILEVSGSTASPQDYLWRISISRTLWGVVVLEHSDGEVKIESNSMVQLGQYNRVVITHPSGLRKGTEGDLKIYINGISSEGISVISSFISGPYHYDHAGDLHIGRTLHSNANNNYDQLVGLLSDLEILNFSVTSSEVIENYRYRCPLTLTDRIRGDDFIYDNIRSGVLMADPAINPNGDDFYDYTYWTIEKAFPAADVLIASEDITFPYRNVSYPLVTGASVISLIPVEGEYGSHPKLNSDGAFLFPSYPHSYNSVDLLIKFNLPPNDTEL